MGDNNAGKLTFTVDQPVATKTCFVICPIGAADSAVRAWSDDVYNHVVAPIAKRFGYNVFRAIDNSRPGDITQKIIGDIRNADLIIADLTDRNPNVFYELALAHAWKRPCILMMQAPVVVPFDIGSLNTISLDLTSAGGVDAARAEVERHFQIVADGGAAAESPVAHFDARRQLDQSADPKDVVISNLADQVQQLTADLEQLRETVLPYSRRLVRPQPQLAGTPMSQNTPLTLAEANLNRFVVSALGQVRVSDDGRPFFLGNDGKPRYVDILEEGARQYVDGKTGLGSDKKKE